MCLECFHCILISFLAVSSLGSSKEQPLISPEVPGLLEISEAVVSIFPCGGSKLLHDEIKKFILVCDVVLRSCVEMFWGEVVLRCSSEKLS